MGTGSSWLGVDSDIDLFYGSFESEYVVSERLNGDGYVAKIYRAGSLSSAPILSLYPRG